jgi:hypothetical protein
MTPAFMKATFFCDSMLISVFKQASRYVCMYKGWAIKSSPCTATLQWSIVLPLLITPLLIPHPEWSVGLCIWARHRSHLVPWKTDPGDEILLRRDIVRKLLLRASHAALQICINQNQTLYHQRMQFTINNNNNHNYLLSWALLEKPPIV